jgi:hypothetical protein
MHVHALDELLTASGHALARGRTNSAIPSTWHLPRCRRSRCASCSVRPQQPLRPVFHLLCSMRHTVGVVGNVHGAQQTHATSFRTLHANSSASARRTALAPSLFLANMLCLYLGLSAPRGPLKGVLSMYQCILIARGSDSTKISTEIEDWSIRVRYTKGTAVSWHSAHAWSHVVHAWPTHAHHRCCAGSREANQCRGLRSLVAGDVPVVCYHRHSCAFPCNPYTGLDFSTCEAYKRI